MVESFAAHFSCATCYISKSQIDDFENLDKIAMRTNSNFYEGLETIPESSDSEHVKGVKRKSELCRLKYCNVPEVIGGDVFHDLDEGVAKEIIGEAINYLVRNGDIPLEEAYSRIVGFDFGTIDQAYCPNDMRHLSGLQVRNVALRFNFIFSNLITPDNEKLFELISHLSTVIQIVYSSKINEHNVKVLEKKIMDLLLAMKIVFPNYNLKWKAHFLTHYAIFVRKLGPLCANETSVFELKHRFFTRIAERNTQFKNILWSFAYRHQISWSDEWSRTKDFYIPVYKNATEIGFDDAEISEYGNVFNRHKQIFKVKKAHCLFNYQAGHYVYQNHQFHEITCVFAQENKIYLKCNSIITSFDELYVAYKIIGRETSSSIFSIKALDNKETFTTQTPYSTNTKFILCKRNVIEYFK